MRNRIFFVPGILTPYSLCITIVMIGLDGNWELSGIVTWILFVCGRICNRYLINMSEQNMQSRSLAETVFVIKCCHLPASICILFSGIVGIYSILKIAGAINVNWENPGVRLLAIIIAIGVLLVIITWNMLGSFLSGMLAAKVIRRAEAEGILEKREAVWYRIGSFVLCADVIVAGMLRRKMNTK